MKNKDKYKRKYIKFTHDLMIAISSFSHGYEKESNELMQLISVGLNAISFNLSKKGKYEAEYLLSNAKALPLQKVIYIYIYTYIYIYIDI